MAQSSSFEENHVSEHYDESNDSESKKDSPSSCRNLSNDQVVEDGN